MKFTRDKRFWDEHEWGNRKPEWHWHAAYENEVHRDMLQDPPEELALVSLTTSRGPWPKRVGPDWRETLATLRDAGELLGSQPLKSQLPIETYHRIGALRDRRDGTR